jgi:pimeloyl-ACP methyl ester carboxylesterase
MRVEIEPGVRLYFDVEGLGLVPDGNTTREMPTLVLLHGGPGMDHTGWKPRVSPLADLAQIVYYDHRSHGRSDRRPPAEWTLDHWADDIVRLCDALGIARPVVFGQSFGGMVAQRYIARHPQHPGKVILSSCSPGLGLARKLAVDLLPGLARAACPRAGDGGRGGSRDADRRPARHCGSAAGAMGALRVVRRRRPRRLARPARGFNGPAARIHRRDAVSPTSMGSACPESPCLGADPKWPALG